MPDEEKKDEASQEEAEKPAAEPKVEAKPEPKAEKTRDLPAGISLAVAAILPTLFFLILPPLSKSGLWDPYELNVADLARRLALNLFHADGLALIGADNTLPHLNDLGRPELPFTSMALGFKLFGLHEWAGRLPLALWGVVGVVATYGFVARLVDRRAGLFSAIALATMPLFFVQARTMLGDVVTMTSVAVAFGGLLVGAFDRTEEGADVTRGRVLWTLLGIGALVTGYYSRGAILGVAVPTLSVGLAWGVTWAAGRRARDGFGDVVGALALLAGASALYWGIGAVGKTGPTLVVAAGALMKAPSKYPTYDVVIGSLGHALAPWSAFAPFAFGRLLLAPVGRTGFVMQRESYARLALVIGTAVAFAAHAYLGAKTEMIPFCAPALVAAACGIALRDLDRGAHPSVAVGVGIAVLLGVLHHDFHEMPEKAYQAFGVPATTFPESFKDTSLLLWTIALVSFALLGMLLWTEGDEEAILPMVLVGTTDAVAKPGTLAGIAETSRETKNLPPFSPDRYLALLNKLREAWDGWLAMAYFALVAGASIAGLAIWVGVRFKMGWVQSVSLQVRDGLLNAWWITAFVPFVVIFGTIFALDAWRWAFDGTRRVFSKDSFTRGFEPFEALIARLREGYEEGEEEKKQRWIISAAVLVPLMVLAVPGGLIAYLVTHGYKWPVAIALGIPSGIALFLVIGFLGDLLGGSRTAGFSVLAAVPGFVLCFGYYPALANQLSPKEVFESYARIHHGSEPLALLGVGGRTAAYYAGGQVETLSDTQRAFQWLEGTDPGTRRWLATRSEELPKLNQLYRQQTHAHGEPAQNLPVLDARSSQILLVASSLEPNEKNQNPFGKILLDKAPNPQHKVVVDMEGKLQVLGYDITDMNGKLQDSIGPGRKYRMRTYYKVLAPVTTEWEAFIHIDGYHRRHNGDHKPLDGKYPFSLWLKDDLVMDDYEFSLEPNFSPGTYTVFFGLFVGDTRMKVTSGPNDNDNRIDGGPLRVQ